MRERLKFRWKELGKAVRYWRGERQLSLRDAEKITGLSKATLSRVERGRPGTVETCLTLCAEAQISPWRFIAKRNRATP